MGEYRGNLSDSDPSVMGAALRPVILLWIAGPYPDERSSFMKKRIIALLMAAAMTLSLMAGCAKEEEPSDQPDKQTPDVSDADQQKPEADPEPQEEKDTFTIAISYMPDNLAPSTGGSDDYTSMTRPIYDRFYLENDQGGIDYYLADNLDISEDGLTYTLHIRDDANWSDGTPITTKDIQFTYDYYMLRNGRVSWGAVNGQPVTITAKDDKTMEFVLPEPYAYYIVSLSSTVLFPAHVFDGDAQKLMDDQTTYTTPNIVTSGPYVVKEINEDSIVFEARQDYYRGVPPVKNVVMKVIGSGSTRAIAFENGEIDYMRLTTAEEIEKYSAQTDKYNMYSFSEARLNYLQINPFGPANLTEEQRQALFYAIDCQQVIDGAYGTDELAQPANSILTPDISLYDPNCKSYTQDLEKAKELAKSSGLEGKTLVYVYNADRPNMEAVAVVLQQQLAQIGVNLQIEGLDSSTFFPRFFAMLYSSGQENTWDLGTNGWDSMRGRTLNQAYSYLNRADGAWGFSQEIGQKAFKINTLTNPDEAKALAAEVQQEALEEFRIYPLTYTNYILVSQKNVTGLDCTPIVPEFADYLGISVNG